MDAHFGFARRSGWSTGRTRYAILVSATERELTRNMFQMKSILFQAATLLCAASLVACGSSDGDTDSNEPTDMEPKDEGSGLPNDVLSGTNGTMPCDPALNTGYPGDELCILPPEPGTGGFFHAGPTDYDNPDDVAPFLIEAGGESTEYYVAESSNDEQIWFRNQHFRMRPGSHHLIMYTLDVPEEIGWVDSGVADRGLPLGGTQVFAMDFPEGGQVAPEDVQLARPLAAHTRLAFELHYVNPGSEPILREAWVNWMHNDDVPQEEYIILGAPFLIGARFAVPPQATQVMNYQHEMPLRDDGTPAETRIVSFFGHRHASTSRFSIWLNREGQRDLVYEDYNWAEAKEFFYNSVIENPAPDPATLTSGAASGIQTMQSGDVLEWECEMTNTLDEDLVFGNGVYVKEMCNVFGTLSSNGGVFIFGSPEPTITTL